MSHELFEHEKYFINNLTIDDCNKLLENQYILDSKSRTMVFERFNKYVYSPTKRELEVSNVKYNILEKCNKLRNELEN